MLNALTRHFQRAAAVRELSALSDRGLADLGIARDEIKTVIRRAELSRSDVNVFRSLRNDAGNAVETFA